MLPAGVVNRKFARVVMLRLAFKKEYSKQKNVSTNY